MRLINERKLDFKDVMLLPKRSNLNSRAEVSLTRTFKTKHSNREWSGIPILASNMYATGSMEMAKVFNEAEMGVALHKFYTQEELVEFFNTDSDYINDLRSSYNFVSIGKSEDDLEKIKSVFSCTQANMSPNIMIDVANTYGASFSDWVKYVRQAFPDSIIIVGNAVTPEMTEQLILDGADGLKIGLGSGSRCQTRQVTGVGVPQLNAIMDCCDAAHGLNGIICSDGGIREVADFCKAFCAGADLVMAGGFFSGVDENLGEWETRIDMRYKTPTASHFEWKETKYLKFFGMSSYEAMEQFGGKEKEYRASEGSCEYIPYRGSVKHIIKEILGGLRSCGTYIGAARLKDFSKCATFVRV